MLDLNRTNAGWIKQVILLDGLQMKAVQEGGKYTFIEVTEVSALTHDQSWPWWLIYLVVSHSEAHCMWKQDKVTICSLMGFDVQPVTHFLKKDYRIKLQDSQLTARCFDSCRFPHGMTIVLLLFFLNQMWI